MTITASNHARPITGRVTHRVTTVTPRPHRRHFGQFGWLREPTVRGISLTPSLPHPLTKGATHECHSHWTR